MLSRLANQSVSVFEAKSRQRTIDSMRRFSMRPIPLPCTCIQVSAPVRRKRSKDPRSDVRKANSQPNDLAAEICTPQLRTPRPSCRTIGFAHRPLLVELSIR